MSGNVPQRAPTPPAMANHPASKFRGSRTMPSWVTDSNDRVGPPPPAPPINVDPEYEVIDVANQQYSNAPPPIPLKSPDIKRMTVLKCDLCGSVTPVVRCIQCDQNLFCASCDERYHRHPKRQTHSRTPVELQSTTAVKPPLPPKGDAGTSGPLPPPRRNKRPGSFLFPSPLLGRKQDAEQNIPTTVPQGPVGNPPQKPPPPPPSPALSLREKMNSLKRFIHPSNRPLPDPPGQKTHSSNSSLDSISKHSSGGPPFRSVSSTMEKIQNNTAATLDRMTLLQQRYRQHQEAMKADSDRSRRASVSSNTDLQSSGQIIRTKPPLVPTTLHHQQQLQLQQQLHQQHHALQPRWIEPPTPRMRSGSVASGINLLPGAVSNECNPPSINPPFVSSVQRPEQGAVPESGPPNPRSTSVFNLNQMPAQQPNMWGFSPLQQAQSMAHINFNQMHWNQMNPWMAGQAHNGSNVSLNLPSSQMGHYPHDQPGYPPGWNNNWGGMYPYPMGLMPMMPGMGMPPPRSRALSRSRAASPALSVKSRKSTMSMRNLQRNSYIDDLTDDEDSEEEFIQSRNRRDRRHRVDSSSSLDFDEPEPAPFVRASSVRHSRFNRDRRGASSARSLIDYPVSQKRDSQRSRYERDELLRDRFDKMSLSSPRKVSDFPNDSDRDRSNNLRANKENLSSPRKIASDSLTNDSDVDQERRRLSKQRTPSSVSSPRRIASDSLTNDSDADQQRRKQQLQKNNTPTATSSPKRPESDSVTNDSEPTQQKAKTIGNRKLSDAEKSKPTTKTTKSGRSTPKKSPSDSHTPDTDGEQKRRFQFKKTVKKHSSTEFIANDSDAELELRKEAKRKNSNVVQQSPEVQPPKVPDEEDQEVHNKTVELKNHINESKCEQVEFAVEESPPPAIVAPDREWECAFCTYVNESGVKICAICCKTVRSEAKTDADIPRSPPPDVVQEPPFEKRTVQRPKDDVDKPLQSTREGGGGGGDTKKKDYDDDEKENGDEDSNNIYENFVEENPFRNQEFQNKSADTVRNSKNSGEIKQNLDSEMVKVMNKVVKEKVSTGCGSSPPRDSNSQVKFPSNRGYVSTDRATIGTSPPPQDMSTQTYDTVEGIRAKAQGDQASVEDNLIGKLTSPSTGSIYKRSHSVTTAPQLLQVASPRSGSRLSFSSDTQSLPPSPHELSPQPLPHAQQNELPQIMPPHPDANMSYLDRAIHQIIQTAAAKTNFSTARPLDQHKYRAMSDLSRIDNLTPTHVTLNDLLTQRQAPTNTMGDHSEDAARLMESMNIDESNSSAGTELKNLLKEAEHYKFTAEELQAALEHCKEKHPVQWLRENWSKLIDTVQTLATKYGHEKRENTIGTISTVEAREALRKHKGNIWHAITECIEQRQRKYSEIASKGNYTREDIVTSLTAHHGNLELAMLELSKTQLKPFLMRIWGPSNGAENDSGNILLHQALREDRSGISNEIQEFISVHVEKELLSEAMMSSANEKVEKSQENVNPGSIPNGKHEQCDGISETTNHVVTNGNEQHPAEEDSIPSNTAILKDIEKLIDQMEKNQANQNEAVLKNIQQLLSKLVDRNDSRPSSQASVRSDSCERIVVKSPIPLPRSIESSVDETKPIYEDIRKFMTENIQEILPSLVGQVQQELSSVTFKADRTLEEDIKETLLNARYSDEDYKNIHNFPFKRTIEPSHDFPNATENKASIKFPTIQEEESEYANIQNFLKRAIRNERLTCEFEQYRTQNYRFDSSSDEARMTAESTDYYDIVTVNQKIQQLLSKRESSVESEAESIDSQRELRKLEATSDQSSAEEEIYANAPAISEHLSKGESVKPSLDDQTSDKDSKLEQTVSENNVETQAVPTIHVDYVEDTLHGVEDRKTSEHENETSPVPTAETKEVEDVVEKLTKIEQELTTSPDKRVSDVEEVRNIIEKLEKIKHILGMSPETDTKPIGHIVEVAVGKIEPSENELELAPQKSVETIDRTVAEQLDKNEHELDETSPNEPVISIDHIEEVRQIVGNIEKTETELETSSDKLTIVAPVDHVAEVRHIVEKMREDERDSHIELVEEVKHVVESQHEFPTSSDKPVSHVNHVEEVEHVVETEHEPPTSSDKPETHMNHIELEEIEHKPQPSSDEQVTHINHVEEVRHVVEKLENIEHELHTAADNPITPVNHIEEVRHVVEKLERIEHELEAQPNESGTTIDHVQERKDIVNNVESLELARIDHVDQLKHVIENIEEIEHQLDRPLDDPETHQLTLGPSVEEHSVAVQDKIGETPSNRIPVNERSANSIRDISVNDAGETTTGLPPSNTEVSTTSEQPADLVDSQDPVPSSSEVTDPPTQIAIPTTDPVNNTPSPSNDPASPHVPQGSSALPQANQDPPKDGTIAPQPSRPSNNLSDLVLDTKRLIQQMKDEIASDMATMQDEDEIYDGEYYEEDEYEEWSDENIDEWESNEEYDVDENGDFYEYEDEDDDGSVMFSEIAPEDVHHPETEEPLELIEDGEIFVGKPYLPTLSLALVREIERNSASEVSDLPLDSDFNDALSVIEQSVGEVSDILDLAVRGLEENNHSEFEEMSEAETVHNSPEVSELSEVTLVADDVNESTEATLVAEENRNFNTMKHVQSLLNAKTVIGQFIKSSQMVEHTELQPEPSELREATEEGIVQPVELLTQHVVQDEVLTVGTSRDVDTETEKTTHVLDATIEMLTSVARDLSEQLRQVSSVSEENDAVPDTVEETTIPEYATVIKTKTTGGLQIVAADQKNIQESTSPTKADDATLQKESNETGRAEHYVAEGYSNTDINQPHSYVIPAHITRSNEETNVESGAQVDLTTNHEFTVEKVTDVISDSTKRLSTSESERANVPLSDDHFVAIGIENLLSQSQTINAGAINDAQANEIIHMSEIKQHNSTNEDGERSFQEDGPSRPTQILASKGVSEQPIVANAEETNVLEIPIINTQTLPNKIFASNSTCTSDIRNIGDQPVGETMTVTANNEVLLSSENSTSSDPAKLTNFDSNHAKTQTTTIEANSAVDSANLTQTNKPSVDENHAVDTIVSSADQNGLTHPIANGETSRNILQSSESREPSEEPSSFIEIQPSEVIIHSPASNVPLNPSPPPVELVSNIYENIEIISPKQEEPPPKSSKLSLKIPTSKSNQNKKTPTPPTTPQSPSGAKTTKITKTKPKVTASTTNTTTTDTKKKTSTASDSSSRRNSLRKSSVGGPFGPVLTNTVKNMQKEFLSKTNKDSSKSAISSSASKPKPSKLVQPKAFINNKLTKPVASTQPANGEAGSNKITEPGSSRSTPGPASGKDTPIGSREGSVTSEQRRKLRKKYMETCFSDDYITSDDDENLTTVTDTESRTIIRSLVKPYEPSEEPLEVQARRILDAGHVQSYQQAELAVRLIEMRYAHDNAIWAATQCHTIEEAKDLLQKECELCLGVYPMNEIVSMLKCTHSCCLDCAKVYFTEEIMHRSITNCNCPYCKEPDLNNADVTEDDVLEYFSNLDILLKNIVDEEVHDLFQRKLRDRTLMQDPNFKWCVDCSSGFFSRPRQKRLICPDCGSITCASCRKPWEPQHEGISCEKFAAWKEANDPEFQAQGVARHLQAHGISCPNCHFKYSLSRGGCMHFTCIQCKFEFCFGCNKPFMMGAKCDVSPYCAKLGLHAHHPRNCLFYLRDKDPRELQSLLTMHNVTYDTEPSEVLKREFMQNASALMRCPIPLQKETPAGLMDTICNGDVPDGHAGLCRTHYVEYLVGAVSKAQIDPLPILDLTDCVQELRRRGMPLPERGPWDTDEIYREMCQKIVKEQIPLN
ncbi:E3 ubiquitin-protein ligase lubel [Sabethes cyaneus]|uniref:E3 ubiquitin-protein ligase lubel n=1 Tax=Sabethes cyaneus TaxID=53552 RepID=UPI00237E7BD7|nr:E3 ubiquitin-protein ligase lubel [Sabethes cyaneus]